MVTFSPKCCGNLTFSVKIDEIYVFSHNFGKMSGTLQAKHHKRLAEVAAHQKSNKISRRALLKFCSKHLVIHQALAQQANTPASEGDPQADESIYFESSNGEIHTTASSKYENVDLHPTESSTYSYSG